MDKILGILNLYIKDYALIPEDDGYSSIVFFMPYKPYLEIRDNKSIFIDAYYKASNELYHITNKIMKELNDNGFEAYKDKRYNLKNLAYLGGLGNYTKTTLIANEKYGTRIVLNCIRIKGQYKLLKKHKKLCVNCNKCIKACPTGALSDSGLDRNKCIRQLQNLSDGYNNNLIEKMGNKVWGCDECQKACPLNKHIKCIEIDDVLIELIDNEKFMRLAYSGKKAMQQLIPYIGYNYLRPKKLLALSLIASANNEDFRQIELAYQLYNLEDFNIKNLALYMINKYNKRQL